MSLTPRQAEVLNYIAMFDRVHGFCPSVSEIAKHIGLTSKSGVVRITDDLVKRGLLRKQPHKVRALTVVHRIPTPQQIARLGDGELGMLAHDIAQEQHRRLIQKARARPTPQ